MAKIAFIFPGQGSQFVGMGKDFYAQFPLVRQILTQADSVITGLTNLCFEGPSEELNLTLNTQPAILALSYALYKLLENEGVTSKIVAGHSLGEYSALLAAGSISYEEALKLVRERAMLMQEACAPGVGAMAAVVGLERQSLIDICKTCSVGGIVEAVNFNCPGQIVIAGNLKNVQQAVNMAKEQGAKLVALLPISIPSHCSLMREAGQKLSQYLDKLTWNNPQTPIVTNVDAAIVSDATNLKTALVKQLSSPVYWEDCIKTMLGQGVDTFVEVGPGNVLSKLLKRIDRNVIVYTTDTVDNLNKTISALK